MWIIERNKNAKNELNNIQLLRRIDTKEKAVISNCKKQKSYTVASCKKLLYDVVFYMVAFNIMPRASKQS